MRGNALLDRLADAVITAAGIAEIESLLGR
jgi:hypothetical protein